MSFQPLLQDKSIFCTNLTKRIESLDEFQDRNTIKVMMDREGYALYFSREPIPTLHGNAFAKIRAYKQVCVIPFPKQFLLDFYHMEPTELEKVESVDMMRVLEHGLR